MQLTMHMSAAQNTRGHINNHGAFFWLSELTAKVQYQVTTWQIAVCRCISGGADKDSGHCWGRHADAAAVCHCLS